MSKNRLYIKFYNEYLIELAQTDKMRQGIADHLDEWMHSDVAGMVKYWHLSAHGYATDQVKRELAKQSEQE